MQDLAKLLIAVGVLIVIAGGAMLLLGRIPGLGKLPGDFTFSSGGLTCFVPIATSIILSILLTVILNVVLRIFNR